MILLLVGASLVSWIAWLPTRFRLGIDYQLYMDATARWLDGGTFYEPFQLTGPYVVEHGAILYPPFALPLFALFVSLPPLLWWAIPVVTIAAVTAHHRPSLVGWLGVVICLWFPATSVKVITGNPVLWAAAAVALGTLWGWPAVLSLLKPTLAPFALIGIRRRSWWAALAVLAGVAALFLPMWPDYIRALTNAKTPEGILYSAQEIPLMALPLLAWLGSTRRARRAFDQGDGDAGLSALPFRS